MSDSNANLPRLSQAGLRNSFCTLPPCATATSETASATLHFVIAILFSTSRKLQGGLDLPLRERIRLGIEPRFRAFPQAISASVELAALAFLDDDPEQFGNVL